MLTQVRKRKEGFTIIEVLIVLAIAGLILLVVFLAVPALQRNARNTERKNDVAAVLGAVSEWSNNNEGKLPTAAQSAEVLANAKLGYYETSSVTFASGNRANPNDTDHVVVVTKAECSAGHDAVGASARQFVALYTVETGNGKAEICQES